ncbi:MAG TPA: hypothetical protein VGF95_05970 [Solirubrobacteraceae bacterium]
MAKRCGIAGALVALALAGCGSSGGSASGLPSGSSATASASVSTSTSVTSTKTTRSEAASPPSKAQALAFAKAVNLRASDLPGFKVKAEEEEHESAAEKRISREVERCVAAPFHEAGGHGEHGEQEEQGSIAEANSPSFERQSNLSDETVSSSVEVVESEASVLAALAIIRSERTGTCFAHYLGLLLHTEKLGGVHLSGLRVGKINAPANGFGWRIKLTLTDRHVAVPLQMQFLGFAIGRAEVTLEVMSLPEQFPIETERGLVKLLMQRAKTQPL